MFLVLDDNLRRLEWFRAAVAKHSHGRITTWTNAPQMLNDLEALLPEAELISLDHDLYRQRPADPDPGSGRDVANFLARREPCCPVIVHSTNSDAAWGMYNALSGAGWQTELVHHLDQAEWVETLWWPKVVGMRG